TRVVPANAHDQDATGGMASTVQHFFGMTPAALLGDSAYGHGRHRMLLAKQDIHIVAPLLSNANPTGLFPSSMFTFDADRDVYICPNGEKSTKKHHSRHLEG